MSFPSLPSLLVAVVITGAACAGCSVYSDYPVGYTQLYYGNAYGYYPYTYFDGRPVYYVDNRWMYRDGGAWRYYYREPPELYRYRSTVRQAPPAYGYPRGGYAPPPAYRGAPAYRGGGPAYGAPPPTRVR